MNIGNLYIDLQEVFEFEMLAFFSLLLLDIHYSKKSGYNRYPLLLIMFSFLGHQLVRVGAIIDSDLFERISGHAFMITVYLFWYASVSLIYELGSMNKSQSSSKKVLHFAPIPIVLALISIYYHPGIQSDLSDELLMLNPVKYVVDHYLLPKTVWLAYQVLLVILCLRFAKYKWAKHRYKLSFWSPLFYAMLCFASVHITRMLNLYMQDIMLQLLFIGNIYQLLLFYNNDTDIRAIFRRPVYHLDQVLHSVHPIRLFLLFLIMGLVLHGAIDSINNLIFRGSLQLAPRHHELAAHIILSGIMVLFVKRVNLKISTQLSEESRLNQELNQLMEKEAEAYRVKSLFLANISHEIRTPMNGVVGMARLLVNEREENLREKYGKNLVRSSENLMVIINDILDFSKLEAGKLEIILEDVNLSEVVEPVMLTNKALADKKGLKTLFKCTLPADFPIRTDVVRLQQILNNILSNAIKFTSSGNITVELNAIKQNGKTYLRTRISDTGIGIPADKIPNLFEKFSQANASISKTYGGTGLGLSIVRQLTELLKGSISVDSEEGVGSTFTILLPNITKTQAHGLEAIDADLEQLHPEHCKHLRLLVAEDNPINQLIIQKTLEKFGISPVMVSNGAQAVETVMEQPFDLILMDLQMPVMDGISASEKILGLDSIFSNPWIVALTADTNPADRAKCEEIGMKDVIIKPFKEEEIRDIIWRVLNAQNYFPNPPILKNQAEDFKQSFKTNTSMQ